jgi:hypothetical protein
MASSRSPLRNAKKRHETDKSMDNKKERGTKQNEV